MKTHMKVLIHGLKNMSLIISVLVVIKGEIVTFDLILQCYVSPTILCYSGNLK